MRPAGSPGQPGLQEETASQLGVDWLWATWTWGLGDSGSGLRRRLRTVQACSGSWRPRSALPLPWDPRGLPLPSANPLREQKGLCPLDQGRRHHVPSAPVHIKCTTTTQIGVLYRQFYFLCHHITCGDSWAGRQRIHTSFPRL